MLTGIAAKGRLWYKSALPLRDDGRVALDVLDDGPGVPENLRAQIFEPFFTTHSKGTGLGLSISRELAEANGATLELCADEQAGLPAPISDSSDASNHDPH